MTDEYQKTTVKCPFILTIVPCLGTFPYSYVTFRVNPILLCVPNISQAQLEKNNKC